MSGNVKSIIEDNDKKAPYLEFRLSKLCPWFTFSSHLNVLLKSFALKYHLVGTGTNALYN